MPTLWSGRHEVGSMLRTMNARPRVHRGCRAPSAGVRMVPLDAVGLAASGGIRAAAMPLDGFSLICHNSVGRPN